MVKLQKGDIIFVTYPKLEAAVLREIFIPLTFYFKLVPFFESRENGRRLSGTAIQFLAVRKKKEKSTSV